jgi:2-methylisocitrate lyase-like PEP mutase family enzyme
MKICEAHSGLSALLVHNSDYDGVWVSSLTHAASKGLPDNELVPLKERVELVSEIARITDKPIIVDIDTGEDVVHLPHLIRWFSKAGAYAVIMEDKKGTKQNSLLEEAKQELEDVDVFCEKIRVAKENANGMQVYARLESLIAKKSKYDALLRAEAYIEAGADGIMVHSKQKVDATEVMEVGTEIFKKHPETRLIAVPTTYVLPELHPFDIIIHANHLLRASLKAMQKQIAGENPELASVQEVFDLVGH